MKIVQAAFGVFHHFELARELNARGHLEHIYSTFPWRRLQREGLPREKVSTFPWVHTPQLLLNRHGLSFPRLDSEFAYRNALLFDRWTLTRIQECDALIALSGAALSTGRLVQARGGKYICDRGSTHRGYQQLTIREEHRRWGIEYKVQEERELEREYLIYEQADAIVVPSHAAQQSFTDFGVNPAKMHVIPYGVRLELFSKVAEPARDTFDVLFVGGVSLRKGIPYLLEAFDRLDHPSKHLIIIGSVLEEIKQLLPRLPRKYVEFLGSLPQRKLVDYMSRSHVLVVPSVEEGLALVQGQALACGCPVVATTASGGEDLFSNGIEGFIVPPRDVNTLAERLQQLADNPALRDQMSELALERVRQIGGWRQYGELWEQLLQKLTHTR